MDSGVSFINICKDKSIIIDNIKIFLIQVIEIFILNLYDLLYNFFSNIVHV